MASKLGSALQDYSNTAPEAGFGPNVNYGRLTATAMVKRFKGKGEQPEEFPFKDGYTLKAKEFLFLKVAVDIQEFNPNLQFEYERKVDIRRSSATQKSDWSEIVLPSLEAVFGANWGDAILKSPYVELEDVPNVSGTVSKSGRVLTVPKFVKVFKNKQECAAAREARFGQSADGDESSSGDGAAVPEGIAQQVKALISSLGGNEDTARTMINASHPFGTEYDTDDLIKAATALG